jgi:hypothetical protein
MRGFRRVAQSSGICRGGQLGCRASGLRNLAKTIASTSSPRRTSTEARGEYSFLYGLCTSRRSGWLGGLRLRDLKSPADLRKEIVDLAVTRNGRRFPRCAVDVHGMFASLAKENTPAFLQMANQVAAFYSAARTSGSRMTSFPSMDSSARARFASRTSSTASARLARASASVRA